MSARRLAVAALLASVLALLVTALPAAARPATPASPTADQYLLLSADGLTFDTSWRGPLFAPLPTLVPGSTATATLYVRNTASTSATLTIALAVSGPSAIAVRIGDAAPGSGGTRFGPVTMAPGATRAIGLVASLPTDAPNAAQQQGVSPQLVVGLGQQVVRIQVAGESRSIGDAAAGAESDPGRRDLSYTGVQTAVWLAVGTLALFAGELLVILGRRRRPRIGPVAPADR